MAKTNVPRLRFSEFDGEWKNDKLNRISSYVDYRGKTPKLSSEGFQLITASNIRKGYIDYNADKKYISVNDYDDVMHRGKPNKGDVLVTTEAPLGNVATVDNVNIALAQRVIKFRGETVGNKYLSYCMMTPTFQKSIFSKSTGGTVKGIKGSTLVAEQINFPLDKEEQQKIGSFFTNIDKLIELQIKKLEQLKKLKRGYLQKMFPQDGESVPRLRFSGFSGEWEKQGLLNLVKLRTGSRNAEDGLDDGKFVFFDRSSEIKFLNEYDFDGEVIVYAGEGAKFLPRKFNGKYSLHQRAYGIYDFKNINFEFLYQELLNKNNHFLKYAVGTTAKSLRKDCFEKLIIKYPSVDEQQQIGSFLSKLDQIINDQSDKIDELKRQKKAYLQKMFI